MLHQEDKDEVKDEEEDWDDREDREDSEQDKEEDKLVLVCVEGFYCFIGDNMIEMC